MRTGRPSSGQMVFPIGLNLPRKSRQTKGNPKRLRQAMIQAAKQVPCADCRRKYPHYVMDFDHVRGEKSFSLNTAGTRSLEAVRKEIEKCDIVCANCHRKRTYKRKQENGVG